VSERAPDTRRPSPLVELSLARLRNFYREPGTLFWSFAFPMVLSLALGTAFRAKPEEAIPVVVVDAPGAAEIASLLDADPELEARVVDGAEAPSLLRAARAALVIEVGQGGVPAYRLDPSRPESRAARPMVDEALQRARGRSDAFTPSVARVTEPGSRYIDFLIPGLIGVSLMQGGLWGVGYVLVDLRVRKLLKRFLATPMSKRYFLLAFVLVRELFVLLELPVFLAFARLVFDVPIHGSLATLALVAFTGGLSFAGIGLLVGSRAQNAQTASGLVNVVSMPMFIASGTFFSSARFPDVVQPVLRLLPLTALNDALRAVMLEGTGLADLARPLAVLAAWGAVAFVVALRGFRWR
jgi:ABC-type multidrug transport system permease subunit